jgi:outer membrane protein OmpA-like peptidoglycan-associated protein
VDVYPVNKDMEPYMEVVGVNYASGSSSGEMIKQVFFPYGSAAISRVDRQELRELAQSLGSNGAEYRLDVVGHASKRVNHVSDPVRRQMINFKIAQRRANAVASTLRNAGVSPEWIVATSAGDTQPNAHREGKTKEAADRRTEVFLNN